MTSEAAKKAWAQRKSRYGRSGISKGRKSRPARLRRKKRVSAKASIQPLTRKEFEAADKNARKLMPSLPPAKSYSEYLKDFQRWKISPHNRWG